MLQGGDTTNPVNYRPITIPSNILRLVTVRMCKKMTDIVEEHKLLGEEQFGFRRKGSTIDAAFVLTSLLQKAKRKGWKFASAFIDIAKAKLITINIT